MAELVVYDLDVSEDDRLDQAEAAVRTYCGWHIAPSRKQTVRLRSEWSSTLILPSLHVTDVAAVVVDGTVVDPTTYDWYDSGVVTALRCGHFGNGPVLVTFTHGYADPPRDVAAAVQALARSAIDNPKALKSFTRGPFSESYGDAGDQFGALDRYKLPPRP